MTDLGARVDKLIEETGRLHAELPPAQAQRVIAGVLMARASLMQFLARVPREHVIAFDDTGWVIEHPLSCRRADEPNLTWCPYNRAAASSWRGRRGRFVCRLSDSGRLLVGKAVPT